MISDLMDIQTHEISEELFVDLGETKRFVARTGAGECAV